MSILTVPPEAVATSVPVPHVYQVVSEEALTLLFRLNGKDIKQEAGLILHWLMSHRWSLVTDHELAKQVWEDLNLKGEGLPVTAAVDTIVELTMRVISQLHYYGIYESTLNAFLAGQGCLADSRAIHNHLQERLPNARRVPQVSSNRTPMSSAFSQTGTGIDYATFIQQEPWVMVCQLLLRSGALKDIDRKLDPRNRHDDDRRKTRTQDSD